LVDQAEETFTKVIAIDPGFDTALLERAKCRRKRGNTAGASADLDAALAVATDDFRVDVLLERAGTNEQDARTAEALADYVEARTLQATSFDAWMGEARCLRSLGQPAESARAATKALELRPDDAEAKALSGR
jgi:tetratricopeptide (TPR) repeat protein